MGASLSSDIYQYKVDSHLEGIENYMCYQLQMISSFMGSKRMVATMKGQSEKY